MVVSDTFVSRWARNDSRHTFSLWEVNGFTGWVVFWLLLTAFLGFVISSCVEDDEIDQRRKKFWEISQYDSAVEYTKRINEMWVVLSGGICTLDEDTCSRLNWLRSYARDEDFSPVADTANAAHFREILSHFPELKESYMEVFDHIRGVAVVQPKVLSMENPRDLPLKYTVFSPVRYVGIMYGILFVILQFIVLSSVEREIVGFWYVRNHTFYSRVAGLLFPDLYFVAMWMAVVDGWDWMFWKIAWYKEQRMVQKNVDDRVRAEKEKRQAAIDRLDPELRASYDALQMRKLELDSLIQQAPTEDAEKRAGLRCSMDEIDRFILDLYVEQDEREAAARERKFQEIARSIDGILADARGRMRVVRENTEAIKESVDL